MKAVLVREFGGIDAMELVELPDPVPAARQVRVRVMASGVNFAETRMRAGTYSGQELPFVMGMESAGVVEAIGEGVAGIKVGDRVFGRARGSHAEIVLFDANHLMPLPSNLSFVEGAAIPVGWLTAWHSLLTVADLQPGQRVLIEAIGSSVGSAALQIAKWRGAWVAGTASRDDKAARALASGADAAYNYKTDDVAARIARDSAGQGVHVALMTIGEETAAATLDSMGMDGKVVMYGSTGGRQICFDLRIGIRNLQLLSMSISTSPRFLPDTMRTFREQAIPLFATGRFKAVVDCVLPLEQIIEAHRMIDARKHFGKVILTTQTS
jgi:NADPH:quinone reductase-like Zn-dependent oxidoreductase